VQEFEWRLLELPAVSPFSFAIYASVIKENMMLEDPASALERIYREMHAKVESVTSPLAS
jgi:ATP-dependent Lhr-like helicase